VSYRNGIWFQIASPRIHQPATSFR
jgi:hypothetical protein